MVGNNLQYEPKFENLEVQRLRNMTQITDDVARVPTQASMGRISLKALKKSQYKIATSRDQLANAMNRSSAAIGYSN